MRAPCRRVGQDGVGGGGGASAVQLELMVPHGPCCSVPHGPCCSVLLSAVQFMHTPLQTLALPALVVGLIAVTQPDLLQ